MHPALVTFSQPVSPSADAFRRLGTVVAASREPHVRVVGAVAPTSADGGDTVPPNLAIALAQAGHRVVLVDGNLRSPSLHTLFGVENATGITTVLTKTSTLEASLQPSGVPMLSLLTSGPVSDAPRFLAGAEAATLLGDLRAKSDYVVVETPPLLESGDGASLASLMDGVFLLLRAGASSREDGKQAKALLKQVHANILGIVLTNATQ